MPMTSQCPVNVQPMPCPANNAQLMPMPSQCPMLSHATNSKPMLTQCSANAQPMLNQYLKELWSFNAKTCAVGTIIGLSLNICISGGAMKTFPGIVQEADIVKSIMSAQSACVISQQSSPQRKFYFRYLGKSEIIVA